MHFATARVLLGLLVVLFGTDYFVHFMPELPISEKGGAFLEALLATGYLFPLIKTLEICCGLMLIAGVAVPLALALLSPIVLNIALYHIALDWNGAALGASVSVLEAFLLWRCRAAFRGLLGAGVQLREPEITKTRKVETVREHQAGAYR
jgi:putative oxidoreductase